MRQQREGTPWGSRWVRTIALALGCAILLPIFAAAQTPTPEPGRTGFAGGSDVGSGYIGHEDEVFSILNDYWAGVFAEAGLAYEPPEVVQVTAPTYGA